MSVFDIALEKRFTDSDEISTIDVTSEDVLLIRDSATGVIMRVKFSTLASAISSAFTGTFASLVDGKVPAAQLPSFVDDVLEYANTAAFPATGETGKIYVALNTNKTYRWSGSAYVEISPSPGSTDSVPEGSVNLYHTTARASAAAPVQSVAGKTGTVTLAKGDVGLANVDNTSDANKPVSTAQATAIAAKADATQEAWQAPTLQGAWANFGGAYETSGYMKDKFGFVHLKGLVKTGTGVIFTLPVGYRPSEEKIFATIGNGALADVRVSTNGNVSMYSGNSSYLSLSGIVFQL
jgi:hypothetical protein